MGDDEQRLLEEARASRDKTQELREKSGLDEEAETEDDDDE